MNTMAPGCTDISMKHRKHICKHENILFCPEQCSNNVGNMHRWIFCSYFTRYCSYFSQPIGSLKTRLRPGAQGATPEEIGTATGKVGAEYSLLWLSQNARLSPFWNSAAYPKQYYTAESKLSWIVGENSTIFADGIRKLKWHTLTLPKKES